MIYKNNIIGKINIEINSARLDSNRVRAQRALNLQIVADSTPYIPFSQGQLRSQVRYPDGLYGTIIEWYAPYAHYQYEGEKYIDQSINASGFMTEDGWRSHKGVVKQASGQPLQHNTSGTSDHWFERAKEDNGARWIKMVKRIAGGG